MMFLICTSPFERGLLCLYFKNCILLRFTKTRRNKFHV